MCDPTVLVLVNEAELQGREASRIEKLQSVSPQAQGSQGGTGRRQSNLVDLVIIFEEH